MQIRKYISTAALGYVRDEFLTRLTLPSTTVTSSIMTTSELQHKEAYFKRQELLDLSDDEREYPDESFRNAERVLADFEEMPPPEPPAKLGRQPSNFLGPTPKELRQGVFERNIPKKQSIPYGDSFSLTRSATAPELDTTKTFLAARLKQRPWSSREKPAAKPKKTASMSDVMAQDETPFYKRMGVVPRELKNGKNVKIAGKIKLDPEEKQLLKGKTVYFFPNDDISMARRRRLHKIIQLGAAWVKEWRDDVTYVIVDDDNHTYSQLLRSVNRAGFPVGVVYQKYDSG
jgi:DNA polymerase IV